MTPGPTPFTRHIASTLRAERARKRVPARDLAQTMDLSLAQTYKVLRGQKPINMDQMLAVCERMGLDIATVVAAAKSATLRQLESEAREDVDPDGFRELPLARSG